jgi:hypothetical protein
VTLVVDDAAASEAPWTLVDRVLVRALVAESEHQLVVAATVGSDRVVDALEALRPGVFRRPVRRVTWEGRSVAGRVASVVTTTEGQGGAVELTLARPTYTGMRTDLPGGTVSTTAGAYTPDERALRSLRRILLGEVVTAEPFGISESVPDFTRDLPDPGVDHATYAAAFTLLATEALVASGAAAQVLRAEVGPAGPDGRPVALAWVSTRRSRAGERRVTFEGHWRS